MRGLGFAIVVVVGGALVASLVPGERRGEGLGLFGIVVGVLGGGLPLGVWLVGRPATRPCSPPGRRPPWPGWRSCLARPGAAAGRPSASWPLRTPALVWPAAAFAVTAMAAGWW